jgi:hypothetical protein
MTLAVRGWVQGISWPDLGLLLPVLALPAYLFLGWVEILVLAVGLPLLAALLRRVVSRGATTAIADQVIAALDAGLAVQSRHLVDRVDDESIWL